MEVITFSVDVLAFEYVRVGVFTIVNNLWMWVAVITAAVSFWMIRNSSSAVITETITPVTSPAPVPVIMPETVPTDLVDQEADGFSQPAVETSVPAAKVKGSVAGGFRDVNGGVTEGKFVVYYLEDSGDYADVDVDGELTELSNSDFSGEWWKRVMKVRLGEMEWYRHQDLTAINGNVVKLWEGVRREKGGVW